MAKSSYRALLAKFALVGVSLGYWNMPDLDRQKFIHVPFASSAGRRLGWTRLYATGYRGSSYGAYGSTSMRWPTVPTVSQIHCLAVDAQRRLNLPDSRKIVIYTGSFNVSVLELSTREVEGLKSTVDALIHAGADGHCLNNYFSLRVPNLGSTRFLTELALLKGVPLHYVSSNRVTLLSGDVALPPGSVSAFPPPKSGSDGFTASKWASERYLEKTAEATGLDVCIHRPCALTGDRAPSEDALNAILQFSVLMKVVPQFPNVRGFFDFEKVGVVADKIGKTVLQAGQVTGGHATSLASFTHHSSGVKMPVDKIQE
ncbi:male sterility protein-domain-containing protein [Aspergillus bertholletiae]|uniref:Male sterility protein-domain-containing protein n=1 Tax=Aspergillus bertholletiae TaxID=1226010 RepID=A0A5N7BPU5_9EURO|nr:male sterility protein-domain-containing protein [Aspergillus bertholletiae]